MKNLTNELRKEFDNHSDGLPGGDSNQGFKNAIAGADDAIVVVLGGLFGARCGCIIGLLEAAGLTKARLIINRLRKNHGKTGRHDGYRDIIDILSIELLGVVPEMN
jgi:septum formation inhibitor-activating ATPase MinD